MRPCICLHVAVLWHETHTLKTRSLFIMMHFFWTMNDDKNNKTYGQRRVYLDCFFIHSKTHTEHWTNKYVNIIRKNEYFRNSSSRHHLNTFVILSWKCVYAHVFPVIQGTIIFSLVGKITADLSIKYELSHIQCNKSFIHY